MNAKPNRRMRMLRDMLDAEGIPWHDASSEWMCRTHSDEVREVTREGKTHEARLFSVICGYGAYGSQCGLLECWTSAMEEPEGYMNAYQAMQAIREAME